MPVPGSVTTGNEGLYRFSGIYASAWRDGKMCSDVVEVSGAIEIGRIEVPLAGRTSQGYKPGRETREGTLRFTKVDTAWEMEVYNQLSQSLEERRANRNAGRPNLRPFQLLFEYDDPDALGIEKWQLDGCLIWRLPLGFAITDDLVDRELPLTWESEKPIYAYRRVVGPTGASAAEYYEGYGPPQG